MTIKKRSVEDNLRDELEDWIEAGITEQQYTEWRQDLEQAIRRLDQSKSDLIAMLVRLDTLWISGQA